MIKTYLVERLEVAGSTEGDQEGLIQVTVHDTPRDTSSPFVLTREAIEGAGVQSIEGSKGLAYICDGNRILGIYPTEG